jgi:hypothetical protein
MGSGNMIPELEMSGVIKYEHFKETSCGNGTRQIQGSKGKEEPKRRTSEGK